MSGRDPRLRGRALARIASAIVRAYTGLGGPVVAVVLFLSGAGVWWALASLVPWFLVAKVMSGLEGR